MPEFPDVGLDVRGLGCGGVDAGSRDRLERRRSISSGAGVSLELEAVGDFLERGVPLF
jgi:hypothetical protein